MMDGHWAVISIFRDDPAAWPSVGLSKVPVATVLLVVERDRDL